MRTPRFLFAATILTALLPLTVHGQTKFLDRSASDWNEQLISRDAKERRAAAFALGKIGPDARAAVPRLVKALNDSDPTVADAAAFALGEIGPAAERALTPLLETLADSSKDARVRRSAAVAVAGLQPANKAAAAGLVKALDDRDASVRQNAAWALGRLKPEGAKAAVEALSDKLGDSDAAVRRDVAGALQSFGPDARLALPALVTRAGAEVDPLARQAVLTTLTNIVGPEDKAIAKSLAPLLEDKDPETARAAAFALGNIGGTEAAPAVEPLRKALRDPDASVRRLASAALANIGPDAVEAVSDLSQALSDTDAKVKSNAALALARIGPKAEAAVPQLVKAMAPKEPLEVRLFSGQAIAFILNGVSSKVLDPFVPDLLRTVKEDPEERVRQRAVWALGRVSEFEESGASAALTEALADKGANVRYSAAQHLAHRMRSKAPAKTLDVLVEMLNDKTIKIYDGASTKVSGGSETTGGSSTVKEKLGGDGRVIPAQALGEMGKAANRPDVIRGLEDLLKAEDANVRDAAKEALQKIKEG